MLHTAMAVAVSLALYGQAQAQDNDDKKWQVDAPQGQFVDANISVSQGTWMNIDVSPDGKTIVYVRQSMDQMTDQDAGKLWILDIKSGTNIIEYVAADIQNL